jgi:hypothetical protein
LGIIRISLITAISYVRAVSGMEILNDIGLYLGKQLINDAKRHKRMA